MPAKHHHADRQQRQAADCRARETDIRAEADPAATAEVLASEHLLTGGDLADELRVLYPRAWPCFVRRACSCLESCLADVLTPYLKI